jgi:hypothetical protein
LNGEKKEDRSESCFWGERAVDIIMKRVKTEGKKDDFDRLCILIVPLIGPGVVPVCLFISAFVASGISTTESR